MLKSIFERLYIIREQKKAHEKYRYVSYNLTHLHPVIRKDLNLESLMKEQEVGLNSRLIPVGRINLLDRLKRLLVHQRLKRRQL